MGLRSLVVIASIAGARGLDLMNALLKSPLYKRVMVPWSRQMMIDTAAANGVPWASSVDWLRAQRDWSSMDVETADIPGYYRAPFHAYEEGNLCWEAAFEQEVASKAVGARNYPAFGADGEDAFRGAFDAAFVEAGARVPDGAVVVDIGSGTGHSTRRLAAQFPKAASFLGVDRSPYFVAVARELPTIDGTGEHWVNDVSGDERVSFSCADGAALPVADGTVDVCVLSLVVHELPPAATAAIVAEAYRVLRTGGQLWVGEMDFETDGYKKLRASPAYAFIRATEPYLDVYADFGASGVARAAVDAGFSAVRAVAATGRHYALVADKRDGGGDATIDDRREETAKPDTHLKTWESRAK